MYKYLNLNGVPVMDLSGFDKINFRWVRGNDAVYISVLMILAEPNTGFHGSKQIRAWYMLCFRYG